MAHLGHWLQMPTEAAARRRQEILGVKVGAAGRPRVMLYVALALWVPLAALIGGIALHARNANRAEAEARLTVIAHNLAVAVDGSLRTQVTSLQTLARSLPPDGSIDPVLVVQRARIAGDVLGGTLLLYGPPPANALLANSSAEPELLRDRIAAGAVAEATAAMVARIRATGQPALSDLFTSPVRPRPLVSIGIPVPGPEPGRRLHLAFEPVAIREILATLQIPPGVRVTIRDRGFRVIASSDPTRPPGEPMNYRWVPERLGQADQAVLTGPDGAGAPTMIAIERLDTDPGWVVMVSRPMADILASQMRGMGWPALGVALALLGILAVAWAARREQDLRAAAENGLLRDAQAQVTRLHAGLPAVLVLREVDAEGRSTRMLYRAGDVEEVLGWPAAGLGDDAIGDLAETPGDLRRFRIDVARDGQARMDLRIRQPDGGWRWIRLRARRLRALPAGGAQTVGYVVDISAERAAQRQAQQASRLDSMTEMAHGLAHELKQPLQAAMMMAGTAEVHARALSNQPALPDALRPTVTALKTALEGCMDQISRTGRLTEHLRRFARGPVEGAPPEPVDLAETIDDALRPLRRGLAADGIALAVDLGDPVPVVMGHSIGVEQILINLLNNARDALAERPADAPRRIRVSAEPDPAGGAVLLHVADTAGGIPEHIIDHVFDPLVTTKGVEEGTGLGLAICRSLARDMDADISVRNGEEGAVFTLRLPVATPIRA